MPGSCTHLYVHFVWATWDRLPLITPEIEPRLHAALAVRCRELSCPPLAIGGTEDHLHVLVRLHATVAVAVLAKELKGSSSHLVTHVLAPDLGFKWQGTYGAFTVSPADVPRVRAYIARQKEHHAAHTAVADWERCMETRDLDADEPDEEYGQRQHHPDRSGNPRRRVS